jgi:hypothetical protein
MDLAPIPGWQKDHNPDLLTGKPQATGLPARTRPAPLAGRTVPPDPGVREAGRGMASHTRRRHVMLPNALPGHGVDSGQARVRRRRDPGQWPGVAGVGAPGQAGGGTPPGGSEPRGVHRVDTAAAAGTWAASAARAWARSATGRPRHRPDSRRPGPRRARHPAGPCPDRPPPAACARAQAPKRMRRSDGPSRPAAPQPPARPGRCRHPPSAHAAWPGSGRGGPLSRPRRDGLAWCPPRPAPTEEAWPRLTCSR